MKARCHCTLPDMLSFSTNSYHVLVSIWYGIPSNQFKKRLEFLAPCYSQFLLLADFQEKPYSSLVLKILAKIAANKKNRNWENSSLCPETSTKNAVQEFHHWLSLSKRCSPHSPWCAFPKKRCVLVLTPWCCCSVCLFFIVFKFGLWHAWQHMIWITYESKGGGGGSSFFNRFWPQSNELTWGTNELVQHFRL
jgi:hypothetical protein